MKPSHRLILVLALACLVGLPVRAALDELARKQLLIEAESAFSQGMGVLDTDPGQAQRQFETAFRCYRSLEDAGIRNGWLYYNLGNTSYRLGDIGRAILYYRRAEFFIPDDPQLRDNLLAAQARRADAVAEKEGELWRPVFFWHYWLSRQLRTTLFLSLVVLASAFGTMRALFPRMPRWPVAVAVVVALLFGGSLAWEAWERQNTPRGVIVVSEVVARKGGGGRYEPSFATPLHAGTEFTMLKKADGWNQVRLLDGRICWLPDDSVGLVRIP